jgi:ribosomal protein S5
MEPLFIRGALVGSVFTVLVTLAGAKVIDNVRTTTSESIMPANVIQAYNQGLRDALRTNPVSMELEMVCLELWANKQPIKE